MRRHVCTVIAACAMVIGPMQGVGLAQTTPLSANGQDLWDTCLPFYQAAMDAGPQNGDGSEVAETTASFGREDLAKLSAAMAQFSPDEPQVAWLTCQVNQRLAQIGGGASARTGGPGPGSRSGGPSSFASGGLGSDEDEDEDEDGGATAVAAQENCSLTMADPSTGVLSTESATLTNGCTVTVGYAYCVKSSNGGGAFSCDGQKFGSGWIKAGGRDAISVALASTPFEVRWGYCLAKPGDDYPLAAHPRWDGKEVNVTCN